ncbi:MAG: adenylyl-sulfate kinase [Clostridiales bacterium]|nr:adenylyl-sulfate kinase [Clostridiales bacterium]
MRSYSGGGIIRTLPEERNITWNEGKVIFENRCELLNQKGIVLWFTGLSGSGKSTIAAAVERGLVSMERLAYRLDGDNIRHGLNSDLGFSEQDRNENIRRISEVAALFKDAGIITLVSFISPFRAMRDFAAGRISDGMFLEIYVKAGLKTCMERDPRGLYAKASAGIISDFTGISSPYEEPENPDIILDTESLTVEESVQKVLDYLTLLEVW